MLGELARVEHRFDDAVRHIGRAAETSGRLGFLQTEAYQLSSLGRAQCQAGDYEAGAATLELGDRQGRGHRRRAPGGAGARAPRPRAARARARRGGAGGARGGGGVAPRSRRRRAGRARRCLLAALDGDAAERLAAILTTPAATATRRSRCFALDALARADAATTALCAEADRRMAAASHFITERDRTDARRRWCSTTNASSPPMTIAIPRDLAAR